MRNNIFCYLKKQFVLICVLILPSLLFSKLASGKYMCVGVSDGDTIWLMIDGEKTRVKIDGIDCPELGQEFGIHAKQFTANLVYGKVIEVNIKGIDEFKTPVAYILAEKGDVGLQLLESGLAWNLKRYKTDDPIYAYVEKDAKAGKVGLWSMANPISPWDYRSNAYNLINTKSSNLSAKAQPPKGQNLDTKQKITNDTPIESQQDEMGNQLSESEEKRQKGLERFEEIIQGLIPKAEEMYIQYTRYSESCFGWQSQSVECLKMWSDYLRIKRDIKAVIVVAMEYAKKAGVYPGQIREVRERYGMAGSDWD